MSGKTDRLNLRCSAATSATLREAAALQGQDLTSFILGAALDRARAVVSEDRALRPQPPHDAPESAQPPDADDYAEPDLAELISTFRRTQQAYTQRLAEGTSTGP